VDDYPAVASHVVACRGEARCRVRARLAPWIAFLLVLPPASCDLPPAELLRDGTFAFGVFGDGPYRSWENGRFRRLIRDVNGTDLQWFVHIGDILWFPCSDEALTGRRDALNTIRHPVIYTPGDNEWTDCHERIAGSWSPLERLDRLRAIFFARPGRSLGGRTMSVETQGSDSTFAEFVENLRWRYGGFMFATLHMVGSSNATDRFDGRSAADDSAVVRRTAAVLAWLDETFRQAEAERSKGIVLAMHADAGLERDPAVRPGYEEFVDRLEDRVRGFGGPVLLIHGDEHVFRLDQPLRDRVTGEVLANFTRLETFGSPDIGWIRVVVDTVAGRITDPEPRLMRGWGPW